MVGPSSYVRYQTLEDREALQPANSVLFSMACRREWNGRREREVELEYERSSEKNLDMMCNGYTRSTVLELELVGCFGSENKSCTVEGEQR